MDKYERELWTEWDEASDCLSKYASFHVLVRKLSVFAETTQESQDWKIDVWGTEFLKLLNILIAYMRDSIESLEYPGGIYTKAMFWKSTERMQLELAGLLRYV